MIEQFLQRKLANLLDQYIQFQKLMFITQEGMTIKNSTIKPKLAQLLSQVMHMPLQLVSGSISSLTLNKPWQKLFFFMNAPIKIGIQNVHIKTKLPNVVNEDYLLKRKQNLIEKITEGLFNPLEAILHHNRSYINKKLKQYFLNTIILQINNICFEIEVDLKQRTTLIIKVDNLKFRKQDKGLNDKEKIHLQILGVGVYYKTFGQKQFEFISPTIIQFQRQKTQDSITNKRSSKKTLKIQKQPLRFNVNNINYGDISRIFLLINWHNSFEQLPYSMWKQRPFILKQLKNIRKFQYIVHLLVSSIKQSDFAKQLKIRRQYINIYDKLLVNPNEFTPQNKIDLLELQKQMPTWKIVAYRNFFINIYKNKILAKKKKAQQIPNQVQKKQMISNTGWFGMWSASEKNKDELQQKFLKKINTIQFVPDDIKSIFQIFIGELDVKLSIITQFAIQPFIKIIGTNCYFCNTEYLFQKTWQKQIKIDRYKIQYQSYLGHSERYKNFISQCKEHCDQSQIFQSGQPSMNEQEDEFRDIDSFLDINFKHDSKIIAINLLPFDIFINYDVIQKLLILLNIQNLSKLSKISQLQSNFMSKTDPWALVEAQKQKIIELKRSQQVQRLKISGSCTNNETANAIQKAQQQQKSQTSQIDKEIIIKTTFNIIIPFDLRSAKSPQLVIQVAEIFFSKHKITKIIELTGIMVKYKMPQRENSQDEQYKHIANYLAPRIQQKNIIRRFNLKIKAQKHENFDNNFVNIDSIYVEIPPQHFLFSLIELIYLHVPKNKQNRTKQYIRRKQSIGQEFIDACQNLKEHITKSMIMSSERLTKKTIIVQKRTQQFQINIKGVNMTHKDFQFLLGQINAYYNQLSLSNSCLTTHNSKNVKLIIHNMRRFIETVQNLKLHITKQSIKRGLNSDKSKITSSMSTINITLAQINLQIFISLKNLKSIKITPSIKLQAKSLYFQNNVQGNYKQLQANLGLFYDQQIQDTQRFNHIPLVEPSQVSYRQSIEFNLLKKSLNIDKISINIKPSLFKFVSRALKDYYLVETTACTILNETINTIKAKKAHQNYYNQYKHKQKFTTQNYYCDILLFGMKFKLQFNQHRQDIPKQKNQQILISQNNFLINSQTSPNNYILQSNIRILNHQDKTLWLKVTQLSSIIATPDYCIQRQKIHRLSQTPKRHFDIDLTQRIDSESIKDSFYSKTITKKSSIVYSPQLQKSKNGKNFNVPLKPKEKVHLLIDSNDHKYLQILDQGVNFTEICINQLFDEHQKVIKGEGQYEDQYLVIRSQITTKDGIQGFIYTFHIYSPIYIVNKTPWELQYRLSQQQVEIEQEDNRKMVRRRSFQLVPLKKIPILSSQKLRNMHYNQIQTMKLQLNKCQRQIGSLLNLIASIKEKRQTNGEGFLKQSKLITLRHKKREIQLILKLQFSTNILKIKLYPQFIFINMTKQIMTFKIKQDQITYPEITIPGVNIDIKSSKDMRPQQKQRFIEHISEYINLSDQRIKQRDALKQLFEKFSNSLQIFTGKLEQQNNKKLTESSKNKRKLIYNTIFAKNSSIQMKLLGRSTKGYLSDYGSDGQFRQQITYFTEQPLQQENLIVYSQQKYVFYKRVLKIQDYFDLILISPTVHIINKSQATFHAKSSCDNLVTIQKNDHHFIHINSNTIDIQASLIDEEISLNEWMKLDLARLGTIYYSKDMIQHHGSGYQSKQYTLRKRRMKKTPKIFYRILLCKFERGQKILIQQSQYPPITFLNNTKYRIKIQEPKQHFIQEFVDKGDMGQYAPRDPYYTPRFRLYVAQKYEYKMLLQFSVQKKQTYHIDKDLIVAVEQYKDKTIVQIKSKAELDQNANLTMSIVQRSQGYQYNTLLQEITKFVFQINQMSINVLNNWNRQLNTNFLQGVNLTYENKNYKEYYKLQIKNIEGYDYMDIKPDFIYKRKKKEKLRLGLLQRQKQNEEMFLTFQLIANYHKNALLIQKCFIKLDQIVFYLSADLILAYVKNYYEPISNLLKVHQYYQSHHVKNKSDIAAKTFIFQSLEWHGTSLKFQTRNLSIMQTFLNKQYQKWLVKFINWLKDIKPIGIQSLKLTYEQITLGKLRAHIDLKKKTMQIAQQLMDYPLSKLKDVILFFLGQEHITLKQKFSLFYNLIKSLKQIGNFTLDLNQNWKSKLKTYNQIFAQNQKENSNIIDKMIKFQFCEWKYKNDHITPSLQRKIRRLQRYNTRNAILQYDQFKAKIKLALDNHLLNKNFKKIQHVYRINSNFIFAFTRQFAIIYHLEQNLWIVTPIEYLIQFSLDEGQIVINFIDQHSQIKGQIKKTHLKTMKFKSIQLNQAHVTNIRRLLNENKLISYY